MMSQTATTLTTQKALTALAWSCVFAGQDTRVIEAHASSGLKPAYLSNPEEEAKGG